MDDLIRDGERSFTLKRMINVQRGITRKDDTLPKRMLTVPKTASGYTPNLPPLQGMLDEYYVVRGWSQDGIPSQDTLDRLEIP
jgi:aldehyde:ferredoxin oxidoreductase